MAAGQLRERLTLQSPDPAVLAVVSLTRAGTTATATTATAHGYTTGDYVTVSKAVLTGYNGTVPVTVTGAPTFTYAVVATVATPATGPIRAMYATDSQGGRKTDWTTIATNVPAEMIALKSWERLQLAAIQSETSVRFRTYVRADVRATWRILWTPTWPNGSTQRTLEINGLLPDEDGRQWMLLDCAVVS